MLSLGSSRDSLVNSRGVNVLLLMVVWPPGCNRVPRRVPAQLYWPGAGALQCCARILTGCQEFPHLICDYSDNSVVTLSTLTLCSEKPMLLQLTKRKEKWIHSTRRLALFLMTSKKWKNETKSLDSFNFKVSKTKWLREILNLCSEGPDYKPATTKILNKFTQLRDFMFFLVRLHKESFRG